MHFPSFQIKKQKIMENDLNSVTLTPPGNNKYSFCSKSFKKKVKQDHIICNRCFYCTNAKILILQNMMLNSLVNQLPNYQALKENAAFVETAVLPLKSIRGGSRINFRVHQSFTKKKFYYNKVRQIKGTLLQIILTEASSKREYHGTGMGREVK